MIMNIIIIRMSPPLPSLGPLQLAQQENKKMWRSKSSGAAMNDGELSLYYYNYNYNNYYFAVTSTSSPRSAAVGPATKKKML